MKTTAKLIHGDAKKLAQIGENTVDLVVTSPPYPMIAMWDGLFQEQNKEIEKALSANDGSQAFKLMHELLDDVWSELFRVLKHGGMACINIGDATRSIDKDFRLYSNHSRILNSLMQRGFISLPDILWRKPTNAPNKFMGSGMLPVGAYVTYEHEYILIVRKGLRREFRTDEQKAVRRESAFFWEERNTWFSDVWFDIRGADQELVDETSRRRSAAYPFELAHRLVCMYSMKGDTVLDPFSGTGMTSAAAMASGRNSIAVEIDESFLDVTRTLLHSLPRFANKHIRLRLDRHVKFVQERLQERPVKYVNKHYGFPVVTAQEQELLLNELVSIADCGDSVTAAFDARPQPGLVSDWSANEITAALADVNELQPQLQL